MAAGAEPGLDLAFDHRDEGEFLVTHRIVGSRRDGARGLTDEHEHLDRHAAPLGHLREGRPAERREPVEGGRVEEVERELSGPDGGAQTLERDARGGQAHHEPRAAQVTRREFGSSRPA